MDLSITRGEIPTDAPSVTRSRNWGRTLQRGFGWGMLGMFFFLLFAWVALPTEAIAWRISHEAKKAGYVVEIEDISVMPWGSATLENVTWTFEPSRPDSPPQQYFMEEIDISIGLLSLIGGTVDVEVETAREDGTIMARYVQGSSETTVEVDIDGLPLYDVPKAAQALNVPLYGLLNVKADITAPDGKFSKAEGKITLACSACRAGDGDSKLYVPGGSKALRDGITLPEIDFGTLTGELIVKKGAATIEEPIATESEDMIMSLTGKLKLKDPFQKSRFNMLMKLELTESFLTEAERLAFIYRGASANAKLDPPERGLGFKLGGPVSKPQFRGVKSKSTAENLADRRKKRRERDRKRAERRSKRGKKSKKTPKKDDKKKDEEKDDEKKDDERPGLNIAPLDDEPSSDERRPALPPAEDDDVEVFDPNDGGRDEPANDQPSDDDRYGRDDGQGQEDGQQGDGQDGGQDDGQQGDGQDGRQEDGQQDDGQDGGQDDGQADGGVQDDGQGQGSGGQGQ